MPPIDSLTIESPDVHGAASGVIDDHASYRSFLREEVCRNGLIPPTHRYRVLRGITRAVFDAIFHGGQLDDLHKLVDDFGRPLVDIIRDEDLVLADLVHLMTGKSGIYAHSVHVATYSVILAVHQGITAREDLEAIATGALLHDIGKRHIPPALLDHPGPLSEQQHEIVKQHPIRGFKELFLRKDIRWEQLMLVYQHHERIDGGGYPVGLVGEEIHPWARICAVADIFHALTSDRPYHQPMLFGDAFDYLACESGTLVDRDMVECWIATMAPCYH